MEFVIGQRWFSESETELGTGVISGIEGRNLRVQFPASGEQRRGKPR